MRWKGFELYLKFGGKAIESLRDYKVVAEKVKVLAEEILGDVQVYVFGSVVEGKVTASSDIDVLVIVKEMDDEKIYRFKSLVYSSLDAPLEVHVTSSEKFKSWYKRFVSKLEEVT